MPVLVGPAALFRIPPDLPSMAAAKDRYAFHSHWKHSKAREHSKVCRDNAIFLKSKYRNFLVTPPLQTHNANGNFPDITPCLKKLRIQEILIPNVFDTNFFPMKCP